MLGLRTDGSEIRAEDPTPKTQDLRPNPSATIFRVPAEPEADSLPKHHRHAVYASETTGLLLIAFLLLVLTLIRYWHVIHWSLR